MLTELDAFFRDFNWNAQNAVALVAGLIAGGGAGALIFWRWKKRFNKRIEDLTKDRQEEQGRAKLLKGRIAERDQAIRRLETALAARKAQLQAAAQKLERLKQEGATLAAAKQQAAEHNEFHRQQVRQANANIRWLKARVRALKDQLQAAADHVQAIVDLEGRFWEKPPQGEVPAFRPRSDGKPPIIAMVNLKGGVGKTTLTAHLGAMLCDAGYRTLLADLDNQGSLTALCLHAQELHDIRLGGGRFVQHLFKDEAAPEQAWNNLTRLGATEGWLLAATEELADAEEHAKARWLLQPGVPDVRYTLRTALHAPLLQDRFDVILLDCPPRLSTACVNALTCADYALIPVLLDKTSADAVPRLLKWLRILKSNRVCPELEILGVLANRTYAQTKLSKRETTLWRALAEKCRDAWGEPVYLFKRWVPDKTRFGEAAESRKLAPQDDDLAPIFKDVLTELQQRKALHDRRRPAAVRA
ncbi:MAG: AAA family ATPase [Gemmataceae bacterium]|nr:AAA family ATPase [Gemmataceae bacterium]